MQEQRDGGSGCFLLPSCFAANVFQVTATAAANLEIDPLLSPGIEAAGRTFGHAVSNPLAAPSAAVGVRNVREVVPAQADGNDDWHGNERCGFETHVALPAAEGSAEASAMVISGARFGRRSSGGGSANMGRSMSAEANEVPLDEAQVLNEAIVALRKATTTHLLTDAERRAALAHADLLEAALPSRPLRSVPAGPPRAPAGGPGSHSPQPPLLRVLD